MLLSHLPLRGLKLLLDGRTKGRLLWWLRLRLRLVLEVLLLLRLQLWLLRLPLWLCCWLCWLVWHWQLLTRRRRLLLLLVRHVLQAADLLLRLHRDWSRGCR